MPTESLSTSSTQKGSSRADPLSISDSEEENRTKEKNRRLTSRKGERHYYGPKGGDVSSSLATLAEVVALRDGDEEDNIILAHKIAPFTPRLFDVQRKAPPLGGKFNDHPQIGDSHQVDEASLLAVGSRDANSFEPREGVPYWSPGVVSDNIGTFLCR